MHNIAKTFEKIKIKATPGSYSDIKHTCKKLQAIIDRRLINEEKKRIPSYNNELKFYSIFIPDIIPIMSNHDEFGDELKMSILQAIVNAWIKTNFIKCGKLVTVFDKKFPLTTEPMGKPGYAASPKKVLSESKKMYMSPKEIAPKKILSSSKKVYMSPSKMTPVRKNTSSSSKN